jgi:hypothetical protein
MDPSVSRGRLRSDNQAAFSLLNRFLERFLDRSILAFTLLDQVDGETGGFRRRRVVLGESRIEERQDGRSDVAAL